MRRSTIPVLLLAILSFFGGLGRGAITDTDEAFYAESAREMVETGDWLTPHFNYEPRFQKPILYYWLTAATFLITGPNEFAARFWSAFAAVGLVLITTACGRRWFDETIGILAGAMTATSFGYFALARMSLPDLPLTFFITLTVWSALVATLERERQPRNWLLIAAAAAALGFLTKGPLGLVIPAMVIVPVVLIERRSLDLELPDIILAVVLFLAVAMPWYVVMWWWHGTAYLEGFFVGDNYERFATARFNDPRPFWFYLPVVGGGLLPWTANATIWIGSGWQALTRRQAVATIDLRLLLWLVLPLIFFTVSVGKQPRYALPVLPPLALLLARSVVERTREWRSLDRSRVRQRANPVVVVGTVLGGTFLIALAVMLYRARVVFLNIPPAATITVVVVSALGGLVVILVSFTRAWRDAPGTLALVTALTFAVLPYGTLTSPESSAVVEMARLVRESRSHGEAIGTYQVFVRNLVFYTRMKHTDLIHDEHILDWLGKNPRALIVMPASEADRLERELGLKWARLAERLYYDEGGIRARMLLNPDPARDLQKVVLVRVGG